MKIEYKNLYTHFVFSTYKRLPVIAEKNRQRIEKYITGIVANLNSKLYAIYANPDHIHFLVSRSPDISDESLATIVADNSERFINEPSHDNNIDTHADVYNSKHGKTQYEY